MKETFDKVMEWLKENKMIAIGAAAIAVLLFFPKLLKFGTTRRRRRRTLPRSVGIRRRRPTIRRRYNKAGKRLKAWQIKGSLAAKRHMAQIRKRR
jgi:hypothetical protein